VGTVFSHAISGFSQTVAACATKLRGGAAKVFRRVHHEGLNA
jgi:hypothetical protein